MTTSTRTPPARVTPRGYVGRDHQTIGSDILAVVRATLNPARTFDAEALRRLEQVKPEGWYPIGWLLDLMDQLYARLGDAGLRKTGRELFKLSHAETVRANVKSARDLVYGFDKLYRAANRGHLIGGWEVELFRPGHAELVKTTPHHCVMEEGIFMEALGCIGVPSTVTQSACARTGADACRFTVSSMIMDGRWSGAAA